MGCVEVTLDECVVVQAALVCSRERRVLGHGPRVPDARLAGTIHGHDGRRVLDVDLGEVHRCVVEDGPEKEAGT
ncbi:MAG: hypothetical protein OHK0013_10660 [Sandaracinaceae bacterium]